MGVRLMPGGGWISMPPELLNEVSDRSPAGGWISLPAELLKEVSDRLPTDVDQIHIRQVCSHWRASTAPLAACRPWIVAAHDRHRDALTAVNPVGEHSLWLPRGGPRIDSRAPAPAGLPYCCGTPRGWLALADHLRSPTRLILWEPLSKAEIPLPTLTTVAQVFLSGDPLASPPGPVGWMAIASQRVPGAQIGQKLFFWRPGDAAWRMQLEYPSYRIEGAAFHQGRFYVSTMKMSLHIYDLQQHLPKRLRSIYLCPPLQARYPRFPGQPRPHVVTCNNQMLLVMVYRGPRRDVILTEVHCPDWDAEQLDLREKVTDLGDYSLFLGRGDTLALSAKEFPAIRRNCVYFVEHDTYKHEQWAVVFDLGSNALERIPHPEEQREGGSKGSGWLGYSWFCPRRPFVEEQRRL